MTDAPQPERGDTHEQLVAARKAKLRRLVELGVDPWGGRFDGNQPIGEIRRRENEIETDAAAEGQHGEQHGPRVRAAGRVVLMRDTGKLI
ncbi:MAG TPA: lysine--tRNA ligase, partial [Pirellulales bacterium]|nr:lysine--tRNA ligase [Pirellulales bacterium]